MELPVEAHLQPGDIAVFRTSEQLHGNHGVTGDRHSLAFFCHNTSFHPPLGEIPVDPDVEAYLAETQRWRKKPKVSTAAPAPAEHGQSSLEAAVHRVSLVSRRKSRVDVDRRSAMDDDDDDKDDEDDDYIPTRH
jgi:hypothetical protein